MENKILTTSGNWSKALNWSPEGVPTNVNDAYILESKEVKLKSPGKCRSLIVSGNISGPSTAEVGGPTKPEDNWAIRFLKGGKTSVGLGIKLVADYPWEPLKIGSGEAEPLEINIVGTANYVLNEPLKIFTGLTLNEGTNFDTQGFDVIIQGFSFLGTGCYINLRGSVWQTGEWRPFGTVLTEESSIIIKDPSEGTFEGQKLIYKNVTIEGAKPQTKNPFTVTGILSFNKTSGYEGINYIKLEKEEKINTNLVFSNATLSEPVEIRGNNATIKLSEPQEIKGFLNSKELNIENGPLYIPNGKDLGGNTGIVFSEK